MFTQKPVHKTALFVIAENWKQPSIFPGTTQVSFLGSWFNILSISQNPTQQ